MENVFSRLAVTLIDAYRKHLSHRKGWCCAHNMVKREGTCSAYGRKVYTEHGPVKATKLLLARLRECTRVYDALIARMDEKHYQAHFQARGFLLSPHSAWVERWKRRSVR